MGHRAPTEGVDLVEGRAARGHGVGCARPFSPKLIPLLISICTRALRSSDSSRSAALGPFHIAPVRWLSSSGLSRRQATIRIGGSLP